MFKCLGCLGNVYHIDIDNINSTSPTCTTVSTCGDEASELTKQGIITKVEEPTPWISNMVAIMKLNKLQLCIDLRDLNKAIKQPKYRMPTLEEVLPTLSKAKIFTMLDAKDEFHQVKLNNSCYLTKFWTLFGQYQYLCTYAVWYIISP